MAARDPGSDRACCSQGIVVTTFAEIGVRFPSRDWTYLYRAVDQRGQVVDVLLSTRRNLDSARAFFTRALRAGTVPAEVTTDRAAAYPRVLDELIPAARHDTEQYSNNPNRGRSRPT